ncbi:MAG: hypothetical protein ACQEQQ_00005, partial [Chloroflexota bacterium]
QGERGRGASRRRTELRLRRDGVTGGGGEGVKGRRGESGIVILTTKSEGSLMRQPGKKDGLCTDIFGIRF